MKKVHIVETFEMNDPTLGVVEVAVIEGLHLKGFLWRANGRTMISLSADLSFEMRKDVYLDLIQMRIDELADEWPEFLD